MRTDVDMGKFERLNMDLTEGRSTLSGLTQRYHETRDAEQHRVMMFRAGLAAQVHWRPGDDPVAAFLTMPPDRQADYEHEVRAAQAIERERTTMRALQARIDALRPQVDALAALVRNCEQHLQGV